MDRRGAEKSREMMLDELLGYDRITIQCHDNPDADAIASGFGLYCSMGFSLLSASEFLQTEKWRCAKQ